MVILRIFSKRQCPRVTGWVRDWGEGGSIWAMHYRIWVLPKLFCFVIFSLVESCRWERAVAAAASILPSVVGSSAVRWRPRIRPGKDQPQRNLGKQIWTFWKTDSSLFSAAPEIVSEWGIVRSTWLAILDFLFSVCDHCQSIVNVLLYIYSMLDCGGLPQFTMFNHWHL